jgi:hypothetical protein
MLWPLTPTLTLTLAQAWMVRLGAKLQKEALAFTDERAKLEGELIAGIEVVKCNAWEARAPPRATPWYQAGRRGGPLHSPLRGRVCASRCGTVVWCRARPALRFAVPCLPAQACHGGCRPTTLNLA